MNREIACIQASWRFLETQSVSGALKKDSRSTVTAPSKDVKSKPLKAPLPKTAGRVKSTGTRSVPSPIDSMPGLEESIITPSEAPPQETIPTTSRVEPPAPQNANAEKSQAPAPTSDPLQVAARSKSTGASVTHKHIAGHPSRLVSDKNSKSISAASSRDVKSKPPSAPLPKAVESITKSTSTRSVPLPADPAPNAPKETPETPPKESVDPSQAMPPKLSTSNTKPPAPQNASGEKPQAPVPTSDPLQVAAQLYPWLYMTSTLDACFQTAERTAKACPFSIPTCPPTRPPIHTHISATFFFKDLAARAQQLAEDESDIKEHKTRFQAEQAVKFYDALSTDAFAQTAPKIMQAFLAHGEVCERAEAEAMQLALQDVPAVGTGDEYEDEDGDWDAPLKVYAEMLDTLESLHTEALSLEASILELTAIPLKHNHQSDETSEPSPIPEQDESGAQAQIVGVFSACLPVVRARIANLAMAQELVDGAQENVSISLRMESLGLLE
ncbi:hypothetical protein H0H87_011091 [Tephrocybe sp. NHM501043]|nr:hypothetical protein H0H87_011091 [Tephrocybe sp. NHM501043]